MRKIINKISIFIQKKLYRSFISFKTNRVSLGAKLFDCKTGKYNYFGPNVIMNNTEIGSYCSFAPNVIVGGMEHDYTKMSTSTKLYKEQKKITTIIEDDVWLGANAVIKMGVTIGRGSIVAASSVVLKDVPPHSIVVGSPAKVVKMRFDNQVKIDIHNSIDFSLSPERIHDFLNKLDGK